MPAQCQCTNCWVRICCPVWQRKATTSPSAWTWCKSDVWHSFLRSLSHLFTLTGLFETSVCVSFFFETTHITSPIAFFSGRKGMQSFNNAFRASPKRRFCCYTSSRKCQSIKWSVVRIDGLPFLTADAGPRPLVHLPQKALLKPCTAFCPRKGHRVAWLNKTRRDKEIPHA